MADPHRPAIFPYTTPDPHSQATPHTIHIIDKPAGFHFYETSVRSLQIPTNPVKQTPWTCVTVRQTKRQPVQANATDLRVGGAVTSCTGMRIPARTAMVMRAPSRALSLTRAYSRPCSYLYGLCARPRQRPGTLLTRPAYGSHKSSANPVHSSALRLRNTSADQAPTNQLKTPGGHGHGVNDDGVAATSATSGGPSTCVIVRPEGRTDSRAIGPGGPITVKPKGLTDLKARQVVGPDGPTIWHASSGLVRFNDGPPDGGPLCMAILCIQTASQQTGTIKPAACGLCLTRTCIQSA